MVSLTLDGDVDKYAILRAKLCTYLKRAYDARNDAAVTRHAVEPMVELLEQNPSDVEKQALCDELKFRIDLLVVSASNMRAARQRCMKAIVDFGVAVHDRTKDGCVLNFLVDYCTKFSEANADLMRAAVCLLVALLFEATTSIKSVGVLSNRRRERNSPGPSRRSDSDQFNASVHLTKCTLPTEHYRTLFSVIKQRRRDVSHHVRIPAIRALAAIQDAEIDVEHTEAIREAPKEMLMKAFNDPDRECRMEALNKLTVCSPAQIQLVLNTAVNDENPLVRRAALEKIVAENSDFHSLRTRDRITLLKNLVHGNNYAQFKEVTDELVSIWINDYVKQQSQTLTTARYRKKKVNFTHKQLFNALAMLINELDPVRNEQLCEEVFVVAVMGLGVEKRKTELNDFVAAIVSYDLGGEQEEQNYLHRANFRQKLLDPGFVTDKANVLFQWRCLLQLCACRYGKPETEAKLADCRSKLVPTMTEYAQFVGVFLRNGLGSVEVARDVLATPARPVFQPRPPATPPITRSTRKRCADTGQPEQQLIHYALRQLFRIFPFLDMDDVGKSHWLELAFNVLANPTVTLREQFLQELVEALMFYHYPENGQTEQALRRFCDAINNIVTRNVPMDHNVEHLLRSPSNSSSSSRDSHQHNPMAKLDEPIRIRCLSIFTTMLRSGRFMRTNVELDGLYEALITKESLSATSAEERAMAYQCLTWRCLLNEADAATFMPIIWHALELHQGRGMLPYLDMIGDLVRFYGYTKMANWYVNSLDEVEMNAEVVEDSFVLEEEEELAVAEGRATQKNASGDAETNGGGETAGMKDERRMKMLNKYVYYARQTKMEPQVVFRATEHLCGWLLCGGFRIGGEASVKLLTHLLLLMFNTEGRERVPEAYVCLSRFMPCFVSVSRRHQQLLLSAFMAAFALLKTMNMALQEEARHIDTVKMATSVLQFTSHSMLAERAVERHLGTIHSEFAQKLLEMVCDHPDELFGIANAQLARRRSSYVTKAQVLMARNKIQKDEEMKEDKTTEDHGTGEKRATEVSDRGKESETINPEVVVIRREKADMLTKQRGASVSSSSLRQFLVGSERKGSRGSKVAPKTNSTKGASLIVVEKDRAERSKKRESKTNSAALLGTIWSIRPRRKKENNRSLANLFSQQNEQTFVASEERTNADAVSHQQHSSLHLQSPPKVFTTTQEELLQFTSHSMLAERAVERHLGTIHSEFAQKLLEMVCDHPDELFAAVYLHLLPNFDPIEDMESVQTLLFLCTNTMKHFEDIYEDGSSGKLVNLRTYLRILTKRADVLRQANQQPAAVASSSSDTLNQRLAVVAMADANDEETAEEEGQTTTVGCTPAKRLHTAAARVPTSSGRKKKLVVYTPSLCTEQLVTPSGSKDVEGGGSATKKLPLCRTPSGGLRQVIARKAKENNRYFADISEQSEELQRMIDSIEEHNDGGQSSDGEEVVQKQHREDGAGIDDDLVELLDEADYEEEQRASRTKDANVVETNGVAGGVGDDDGWDFPLEPMETD
uniref:Cnd3 domain-containing protein n=1 Tax=Globodera pallida TaxID=36090 RepID=A0A183BHL5_GLOPA